MLSHSDVSDSFVALWTVAHQAPLSMGFSRQEYWSGLPFLPPEDLPDPGVKLTSPHWQADSLPLSHLGSPNLMIKRHGGNVNMNACCRVKEASQKDYILSDSSATSISPPSTCLAREQLVTSPRILVPMDQVYRV